MRGFRGRGMPIDPSLIGREYYVFRDNTHNLIFIEDPELGVLLRKIIDTAEFQRLRRVRQNGLGFLVYPSMETSRFPHAIGSFAVAKRVIEALQKQQPIKGAFGFPLSLDIDRISAHGFCIAAALHDIAHGPLSHSWEQITARLATFDNRFSKFHHEEAGAEIVFSQATELGRLLASICARPNDDKYEKPVILAAMRFLKKKHRLIFLRPLFAGNLDIDRLDFINRDTRAAGVTYGDHDLDWLVRSMRFGRLPRKSLDAPGIPWVIAIDGRKGLNALVQYLRARENMYSLVYLHKTVRAANAHLGTLFAFAARLMAMKRLTPDGSALGTFLETGQAPNIATVDDADIWTSIKSLSRTDNDLLSELANRFLSRKLFKSRKVCAQTAAAIEAMLADGSFASRIRGRLSKFPSVHDHELLPDRLLCDLFVNVDDSSYDIIGGEPADEEQTWIMYRRHIEIGLTPLRNYWQETIGRTDRPLWYVHYLPEIEKDILEFITPLEGAFAKLGDFTSVTYESERTKLPPLPTPPDGFEVVQYIASGQHKAAYLGICKQPLPDNSIQPGDACVLKQYHNVGAVQANLMRDCIGNIYGIKSQYLTSSAVINAHGTVWLIERYWASDLLKLTYEAGVRTDLHFLLIMARDLFCGLRDLAERGIRHGDLKLENCGVIGGNAGIRFQLGDFGLATADPERVPEVHELGTLTTRPPELLASKNQSVSLKSDVWSLAATVYAAMAGTYPFIGGLNYDRAKKAELTEQIIESLADREKTFRNTFDATVPDILASILRPCLFRPQAERPEAAMVAGQLGGAVAACENAQKNEPFLWQRGLDERRLLDVMRDDENTCESVRHHLAEIAASPNTWTSPDLRRHVVK